MGVRKGDVVAVFMTNCPDYITCLTGIIGVGAIATPINPEYTITELAKQLKMAKATCIIAKNNNLKIVKAAIAELDGRFISDKYASSN